MQLCVGGVADKISIVYQVWAAAQLAGAGLNGWGVVSRSAEEEGCGMG